MAPNEIIRVDTNDLNFDTRTKEYWIDNAGDINVTPHGILEFDGTVYWVELTGDHLGELDPDTGKMTRHPFPTKGAGAHSAWADSRGTNLVHLLRLGGPYRPVRHEDQGILRSGSRSTGGAATGSSSTARIACGPSASTPMRR